MKKFSKLEWLLTVSKILRAISEILMIIYNLRNETRLEEETKPGEVEQIN